MVHGGDMVIRDSLEEHWIPAAHRKNPITLVHVTGEHHRSHGKSLANYEQEDMAMNVLTMLRGLDPMASVTVLCYYVGTAQNIAAQCDRLRRPGTGEIKVNTIPAYIGNEADYEILVTTRCKPRDRKAGESEEIEQDFVHEVKATTVALTRAKEGLWIIGNMDYLSHAEMQGPELQWMKMISFIRTVTKESPPVDAMKYRTMLMNINDNLMDINAVEYRNGILKDPQSEESMVADCRIASDLGWFSGSFLRRESP
jgi:hypothetical protein